jgi:hypothetical protein
VSGDPAWDRPIQVKQAGRCKVGGLPFVAVPCRFHRVPHDRVEELRRVKSCQHLDAHQSGSQTPGRIGICASKSRGVAELTPISQHRQR